LTNAEDDARVDAAERADELAEAAPTDDVKAQVGDSDPVKAIEDALRTFPADEVIVVTLRDEDSSWLEKGSSANALERFSLPVTHLVVEAPGPSRSALAPTSEDARRAVNTGTPNGAPGQARARSPRGVR
jgi:hypothetical protein